MRNISAEENMTESEKFTKQTLEQLGFRVEKLKESKEQGQKMPDFLVTYRSTRALMEAKLKDNDADKAAERELTLAAGEVYASDHILGRNETLSGIIKKVAKQLKAETGIEADFQIFFSTIDCINARVVSEQLVDTLYGRTNVVECDNLSQSKPCYFYRNSDFYRRREIDAAIICYMEASKPILTIYLNPYSPNYKKLKESDFLEPFGQNVLDPIVEEEAGRVYIPDAEVERKEIEFYLCDPVLRHLANKYKTGPLMRLDFNAPEITVRLNGPTSQ